MSANHIHSSHLAQKAHHQSTGPLRSDPTSGSTSNHIPCGSLPGPSNHNSQFASDGILPSINTLGQNPSVLQSVAEVMATYENQAKQEAALGKGHQTKISGRFNTTDTITSVLELRWPNEGYHLVNGRKRIVYDELSLPEWAVGQLSNIYQIHDPTTMKRALLQTIMALKDTTSLPWPAVRSVYAKAMGSY